MMGHLDDVFGINLKGTAAQCYTRKQSRCQVFVPNPHVEWRTRAAFAPQPLSSPMALASGAPGTYEIVISLVAKERLQKTCASALVRDSSMGGRAGASQAIDGRCRTGTGRLVLSSNNT
jgi:hypothetical protein